MSTIFRVLENLKHNGVTYNKGDFVTEISNESALITDGVLTIVKGAKTIDEARGIVFKEVVNSSKEEEAIVSSQDTWGPQPDEVPVEEIKEVTKEENINPVATETPKTTAMSNKDTVQPTAPIIDPSKL